MGWMSGSYGPPRLLAERLVALDASLWLWTQRTDDLTAPEIARAGHRTLQLVDSLMVELTKLRHRVSTDIEEFDKLTIERAVRTELAGHHEDVVERRQTITPQRLRPVS
jgi:hypothetical protein